MPPTTLLRLLSAALRSPKPLSLPHHRFCSSSSKLPNPNPDPPTPTPTPTRTPLQTHFETWIQNLKPGFTPSDVTQALLSQPDPDLALDIFRWTARQRHYNHTPENYLTIFDLLVSAGHYRQAETLLDEILAGACRPTLPLYNAAIRFCSHRKFLFNRAFDFYKKMLYASEDARPDLETFSLLFSALLRRFNKLSVCFVYLRAVRSLRKQMKWLGVVPDTFVLNMIVKAFAKCGEMDEAVRVFREMGLYGSEPNSFTFGYLAKGLCEKGRVGQGFGFYREMRERGLVPSGSCFMVVICGLALERRFEDATEVLFDMLEHSMSPDFLTYKTVLEGMCREGRGEEAVELLEELRKRDKLMSGKTFKALLSQLHFVVGDDG